MSVTAATNDFLDANQLGVGGFGLVYKAGSKTLLGFFFNIIIMLLLSLIYKFSFAITYMLLVNIGFII